MMNLTKIIGIIEISMTCLLCSASFAQTHSIEAPPLTLFVGEQRRLFVPQLVKYSPSGSSIRAKSLGDHLLIKAVREGNSDLLIWNQDGESIHRTVHVEKNSITSAEKQELMRDLSQLTEAEVICVSGSVVLRGELHSFEEVAKVHALKIGNPKLIQDETRYTHSLIEKAVVKLTSLLKSDARLTAIRVESGDDFVRVQGGVGPHVDAERVRNRVLSVFAGTEVYIESLPDSSPTVHFKVFLLEIKKSMFGSFGLSWPGRMDGAFTVSPWGIKQNLSLDAAIEAMEGEGNARVLSKPELVVRAPGEAELFAGGEVPIKTHTEHTQNVTWKTYGLLLKLKVTHSTPSLARLEIATEVSHLDNANSIENLPGVQANRMKTQVDATYGRPLFLSGLLQEDMRSQAKGLPLLRRIPILGSLFGSEDYLNERSELVAILLPENTPAPPPMHRVETSRYYPKGNVPFPRNWLSAQEELELKSSENYPWNALE